MFGGGMDDYLHVDRDTLQKRGLNSEANNFFETDTPHGYAKRIILKKYLQSWVPRMFFSRTRPKTIMYVDGFSGAGKYSQEDQDLENPVEVYGSPVIAMDVMLEWSERYKHKINSSKNCKLNMILIEKKRSNLSDLSMAMAERENMHGFEESPIERMFQNCEFANADFNMVTTPCFAFIDPFGFTHTPMTTVQTFIGEGRELLLNLMVVHINRFGKIEKIIPKVVSLFNGHSEYLEILKLEDSEQKAKQLVSLYEEELRSCGARYVISFCMEGKHKARTRYYLVFATTSLRSLECMKESMNRVTQEQDEFKFSDKNILDQEGTFIWSNDQDSEGVVKELIYSRFAGYCDVHIDEIHKFVVLKTGVCVFRKQSLKSLEIDGQIISARRIDGHTRRKYTFPDGVTLVTFLPEYEFEELEQKMGACALYS